MSIRITFAFMVIVLVISSIGCTSTRTHRSMETRVMSHAIFNPVGSPVALADFDRSDWPVAYLGDAASEEVQYHERIVDVHGRGFGRDDGFLFRRFESDRFGRLRR